MNYFRLGQVVGVIAAGLGVGLMFAAPEQRGGLWAAGGILLYAVCRLVPWLTKGKKAP